MSHPVDDQLQSLATEVRDLTVPPAAEIRARGNRRARRQLAAVTTAAGAVAVVTAGVAFAWPQQQPAPPSITPAASSSLTCVTTLPDAPADVRVQVNGAAGIAAETATELRARSFTVVGTTAISGPAGKTGFGPRTTLYYGPRSIGTATLLRAAVHGEVDMRFEPHRDDDTIELVLGREFTRLATTTELNQAMAAIGEPTAPPGC